MPVVVHHTFLWRFHKIFNVESVVCEKIRHCVGIVFCTMKKHTVDSRIRTWCDPGRLDSELASVVENLINSYCEFGFKYCFSSTGPPPEYHRCFVLLFFILLRQIFSSSNSTTDDCFLAVVEFHFPLGHTQKSTFLTTDLVSKL